MEQCSLVWKSAVAVLIAAILPILELFGNYSGILACPLVNLAFVPSPLHLSLKFLAACTELCDGLLRKKLLQCPLLDVL